MAKVRVMARAIDMLGRQQIAGIPTAIHELFKNAHDAYADEVRVDYYRSDALFVLRDDGIGMTEEEFLQRWLTVGTDSKMSGGTLPLPVPDDIGKLRPVLGEKGIGRLAIATIGPQVLVLTRSKKEHAGNGVTAALVHWGLFQLPGLPVDNIDLPVVSLGPTESAGPELVSLLKEHAAANVSALRGKAVDASIDGILADIAGFDLDLPGIYEDMKWKRLDAEGDQGTHFFIFPADRIIEADMAESENQVASPLTKALVGFSNTMIPGFTKPPLTPSFSDHRLDGTIDDRISPGSFFTPEEFLAADHRLSGTFDEYGTFRGTVTIYGGEPVDYICTRSGTSTGRTDCGPFSFDFAYVQGNPHESRLERAEFARMHDKLTRIGGIYIYRDGIRILPYGDSDFDFLDIERRRSKGAGHYFFSYRRMFGAIQVTRETNSRLVEKAGREGFQQNRAYREFKQILENLLLQVGATFFREGAPQSDAWEKTKGELEKNERVRKEREKHARSRRGEFSGQLEAFFNRLNLDVPGTEVASIADDAEARIRSAAGQRDKVQAAEELLRIRQEALRDIERVQRLNRVAKPSGVGLTKSLTRDWSTYRLQYQRMESEVFAPASARIEETIAEEVVRHGIPLDRSRRLIEAVRDVAGRAQRDVGARSRPLLQRADSVREMVATRARRAAAAVSTAAQELLAAAGSEEDLGEGRLAEVERKLVTQMGAVSDAERDALDRLDRSLAAVLSEREGRSEEDVTEALEEQVETLREELDLYVELAQVGMAVGVVQHDFVEAITTIRQAIRALGPWAEANPDLRKLQRSLRDSFEHLDGYLNLFTPMNRRLHRTKTTITGENILTFLDSLMGERLSAGGTKLEATKAFRRYSVTGFPSTFLPVFVNLVDNARHWVTEDGARRPVITLEADGRDLLVQDSGPGVSPRDREAIFDYGFTKKRAGRGLGLFITRQVLEREGWTISLDPAVPETGASFRLTPPEPDEDGAEEST